MDSRSGSTTLDGASLGKCSVSEEKTKLIKDNHQYAKYYKQYTYQARNTSLVIRLKGVFGSFQCTSVAKLQNPGVAGSIPTGGVTFYFFNFSIL